MYRSIGVIRNELSSGQDWKDFVKWPPNVFALTSILLADSGIYRYVVSPTTQNSWPPFKHGPKHWKTFLTDTSEAWRRWANDQTGNPPLSLKRLLDELDHAADVRISDLKEGKAHRKVVSTLLALHVLADETCAGIGLVESMVDKFHRDAVLLLLSTHTLAKIPADRIQVLPKFRTPQVGITLRSLSHHLAVNHSEVAVKWRWFPLTWVPEKERLEEERLEEERLEEERLNLLLIPWPFSIDAGDFHSSNEQFNILNPRGDRFFEFSPRMRFNTKNLISTLQEAREKCGQVHGVVLPEAAVTDQEFRSIRRVLSRHNINFLLAGVRGKKKNDAVFGLCKYGGLWEPYSQSKHHRWCIDEAQIHQYHLGSSLHPSRRWWEAIDIPKRGVEFITASSWLTLCHLNCEDLARQDPVSHVIRSVGPNLLIALLQDGPQLDSRWSGRYASALADDPGTSVLTLTSLGMALRSVPPGKTSSPIVALWKDRRNGSRELAVNLDSHNKSLLLSVCAHLTEEISADGRSDGCVSSELVLAGVDQI